MQLAGVRAKARELLQGDAAAGKRCRSRQLGRRDWSRGRRDRWRGVRGCVPRRRSRYIRRVAHLALEQALVVASDPTLAALISDPKRSSSLKHRHCWYHQSNTSVQQVLKGRKYADCRRRGYTPHTLYRRTH